MSLPASIKQWETSQDGVNNLKQTTVPIPTPGPNEVLVKISTVSINYRDTEVIMGMFSLFTPNDEIKIKSRNNAKKI